MARKHKSDIDRRINRAVIGFQIPMMDIPALYRLLKSEAEAGATDDILKSIVGTYPGVTATTF